MALNVDGSPLSTRNISIGTLDADQVEVPKGPQGALFGGKRAADPQNHFDLGSHQLLNARLGVANGRAEYYVWGSNLLDRRYDLYGDFAPPSVAYGAPARGRTLGVGVSYPY